MIFLMMHGVSYAHGDAPQQTMSEYRNGVIKADFSVDDHSLVTLALQCKKEPICFYYPRTFQESENSNIKRFFLPRTTWSDDAIENFVQEFNIAANSLHIVCSCRQTVGKNFGLEIILEIDSSEFEIKKSIDADNNAVRFEIRLK